MNALGIALQVQRERQELITSIYLAMLSAGIPSGWPVKREVETAIARADALIVAMREKKAQGTA